MVHQISGPTSNLQQLSFTSSEIVLMVANGVSDSVNGPQASCSPLSLENINPKVVQAQYAVR